MLRSLLSYIQCLAVVPLLIFPTTVAAKEHVLIIGGAGHAGSAVAKMLIDRGDTVTAFVRSPRTDQSCQACPSTM